MGFLDRFTVALGAFHGAQSQTPQSTHRRARARAQARRSFAAAMSEEIFANFLGTASSVNGDLHTSLKKMRQRARQEAYDDPYVVKFLGMFRSNVIGPQGMGFQADFKDRQGRPDTGDNAVVEEAFAAWGRRGICDMTGRLTWVEAQALAATTIARDGEVLVRLVRNAPNEFGFAIQLLETDYLDERHVETLSNGNRVIMGVELDKWGRAVAFHLRPNRAYYDPIRGVTGNEDDLRLEAADVLHPFPSTRTEQVRGFPLVHAVLRRLHMLDGYEEAEVVAARKGAVHGGFYTTPTGEEFTGDDVEADGTLVEEIGPGEMRQLPEGWDFKPYSAEHPTTAYKDFVKGSLRGVAAGLNVPYNSLAGDLESVNYSSLRQGALEERDLWRVWQRWYAGAFCQPIYEAFLDMAILKNRLKLPAWNREKYLSVKWQPRGWVWVDPLKEVQATKLGVELGVATRQDALAAQGKDFDDVVAQLVKETEILRKAGLLGLNLSPAPPPPMPPAPPEDDDDPPEDDK